MAQSVHNIGYLQKPDHSWTVSNEETLGLLIDTHFPDSSENHTIEYTLGSEVETESPPVIIGCVRDGSHDVLREFLATLATTSRSTVTFCTQIIGNTKLLSANQKSIRKYATQ